MRETFVTQLRDRRRELLREVAETETDLRLLAEERESEIEERAQEERMARLLARLDDRERREIAEVDAALERLQDGSYGRCRRCHRRIPIARLQALPATPFCIGCARATEARAVAPNAAPTALSGRLSGELSLLNDRELEQELHRQVRLDGRLDTEELRLACRHGVVRLEGVLPSEAEHRILLRLLWDVAGVEDVVDRLQISELPWERDDRSGKAPREWPDGLEPPETEDVVESAEEGLDYVAPVKPPSDED
jgi:RNA polymerase-binding protein DksA